MTIESGVPAPGLGLDLDEQVAAKSPMGEIRGGGAYNTDRMLDGTVVRPWKTAS